MTYKQFALLLIVAGAILLPFPYLNLLGVASLGMGLVILLVGRFKPENPPDRD
jgi:hypothetical protein